MVFFFIKPEKTPTPSVYESQESSENTEKTVRDNVIGNDNITGNSNIVGNDNIKGNSNIVGNNNTVNVNPQPTKKNKSIELSDLLKMFLIPSNASYNTIDWSAGASEDSPIVWETSGASEGVREGKVAVTINGKNSYHTLLNKLTPGLWNIKLSGPNAGVTRVSIRSERISRELDPHQLGKQVMPYLQFFRCGGGSGTGGVNIYEMNIPGQAVAWLKKGWSCGSAGCGIWLEIIYNESAASKEECEI